MSSTESKPPVAIIEPVKSKTEWTTKGYRLDVMTYPESLLLTCETQAVSVNGSGERFTWLLGRVAIIPGSLRPDAERFAAHAMSIYEDPELTAAARAAVVGFFEGLKESTTDTPAPPPFGTTIN